MKLVLILLIVFSLLPALHAQELPLQSNLRGDWASTCVLLKRDNETYTYQLTFFYSTDRDLLFRYRLYPEKANCMGEPLVTMSTYGIYQVVSGMGKVTNPAQISFVPDVSTVRVSTAWITRYNLDHPNEPVLAERTQRIANPFTKMYQLVELDKSAQGFPIAYFGLVSDQSKWPTQVNQSYPFRQTLR